MGRNVAKERKNKRMTGNRGQQQSEALTGREEREKAGLEGLKHKVK